MLKNYYEKYMMFIGILGQCSIYIQAYVIFENKSATDISLLANLFTFISLLSWLFYGLVLKNKVLFISNIFAIIGNLLIIFGIFMYN